MAWLRLLVGVIFAAYGVVVSAATLYQRGMLFHPDVERTAPDTVEIPGVSEEVVETSDGARLINWWLPPKPGKPVVVYFHGNGGNVSYRSRRYALCQRAGFGVFAMGYRGYGGSTGNPSEASLMADARLVLDRLVAKGYAPARLVLFGESLGTGIAVAVAAERPVGAVILDSPYTTLVDVAAPALPLLPVRLLMWDRFDSLSKIGKVRAPLLIIHGDADEIVPIALGRRLFAAANEPKSFVTLKGAGHVTPLNDQSWGAIKKLVEGVEKEMEKR